MQTRKVGWIITTALLVVGLAGCRNLPRGGLGRGPDVRTIAGVGIGPERLAIREGAPSTISSRVDPPASDDKPDEIVGQVVDDRGVPVANARVRLAVDGTPGGREVVGTTNRSGQFLLRGLRPGDDYTLIAEWDDGQEFLLGRSKVSAPSEKVRIEVASVEGSDRPSMASNAGLESSRVASFNREDRAPERISLLGNQREDAPASPRHDDRASSRNRAGWIPFDSVNRTSLDPSPAGEDRDEGSRFPGANPAMDRPLTEGGAASTSPAPQSEPDPLRERLETIQESSDLDPNDFPLPMAAMGEPRSIEPGRPASRTQPEPPASTPQPRPMTAGSPRTTAETVPLVKRFEPARDRDREEPDPPLLMTDAPPETEPAGSESATNGHGPGSAASEPGSMRLPEPEPDPSTPSNPDARSAVTPFSVSAEDALAAPSPEPDSELAFPEPLESAELPSGGDATVETRTGAAAPFSEPPAPAEMVEIDQGESPSSINSGPAPEHSAPMTAENGRTFRWSDLPPPAPLNAGGADEKERGGDASASDENGPAGWTRGLLKWVSRERDGTDQEVASVEPTAQFDPRRNRLEDFVLPDLNGQIFRLKETDADYVLLCFWGTWCDPCVAAMPHLADLQRQFGPSRLRVVSIAYQRNGEGGPRSLARVSRRLGLNYPILLAPTDQPCPVAEAMAVQYYPTLVLLDRQGNIIHRETGATGDKLMRLDRAIAAAMDESVMTVTKR